MPTVAPSASRTLAAAAAVAVALTCACAGEAPAPASDTAAAASEEPSVAPDVARRMAQYAPVELTADLSHLAAGDREALRHAAAAARRLDDVFLRQVWQGNPELAAKVAPWTEGDRAVAREFFALNFGPWDRLADMEPFLGGIAHPAGAGFYPEDMTREEFEAHLAAHPEDREAFVSPVTVLRRRDGRLAAVPYATEYRTWLAPAADDLRKAAAATTSPSLARFLELRADALLSDDYYESDLAWMDVEAPLEVTLGPYETYEDGLFGYKAAFEAYLTVEIPAESKALAGFKEKLPWLEANLPLPDEHKNPSRGTESPIRVVDLVLSAGDARAGVATLAYNLPNDERVREAKGSKKVLLRNVLRAKYDRILVPIAERTLAAGLAGKVSFDAYFAEVLHHELAHGLGPGKIAVGGRATEVRLELKELYSTLEEAKADVAGVYDILALVEQGAVDRAILDTLEPTYLAGLFRSARFGVGEAHGQGVVAQFNYLKDKGALTVDADGRYRTVPERFPGAIRDLLAEMLLLQARGDYAGTQAFLERWGQPDAALLAALARLADVPVDVRGQFAAGV